MFSERALASQTVDIVLHGTDSSGVAITGATDFIYSVYRQSDAAQLDFSDSTFGGTITTGTQALTEIGTTAIYSHRLDLSAITNHATAKDTFYIVFAETGTDLLTIPRGEIVVNPDDMIAVAYDGAVNYASYGVAGAYYGVNGTRANPSDVIANARTLLDNTGYRRLRFMDLNGLTAVTLPASLWDGYQIGTPDSTLTSISVGTGTGYDDARFTNVRITGVFPATGDTIEAIDSEFTQVTLPDAVLGNNLRFSGTTTVATGGVYLFRHVRITGSATLAFAGVSASAAFSDVIGNLTIDGMSAGGTATVFLNGGSVTINASCTSGTINISGVGTYDDNGTATVDATNLINPHVIDALMLGNYVMDTVVYDSNGFMSSARLRVFDSSTNTPSSGGGSETAGLLKTVTIGTSTANSTFPSLPGFVRGTV